MSAKPKDSQGSQEELAMDLAETTDLSPKQARELIERHGQDRDKLMKIARTMKAEG